MKPSTQTIGDREDLEQEGIFDKVESLDLNYEQAGALFIAIDRQLDESNNAIGYYKGLTEEEIKSHDKLTPELIEEELELNQFIIDKLEQTVPGLKLITVELEPLNIEMPKILGS